MPEYLLAQKSKRLSPRNPAGPHVIRESSKRTSVYRPGTNSTTGKIPIGGMATVLCSVSMAISLESGCALAEKQSGSMFFSRDGTLGRGTTLSSRTNGIRAINGKLAQGHLRLGQNGTPAQELS